MADLPKQYCQRMKSLLGEEYGEYLESFSQVPRAAYRVNTWKVSLERWRELISGMEYGGAEGTGSLATVEGGRAHALFSGEGVPWCEKGFYYSGDAFSPAKHPYYFAGLYYIQEPSAMIPASILPIEPGDLVLDLCAAPGGKATELGSRLGGTGFLVANDVSASRAMALAKNLQLAGIANGMVTAETPERLARAFPEGFDKILIDAPCSGEGMFRREPRMVKDWLEKGPDKYAPLQREILEQAYGMLRPGGMMVYSTCTFSVEEDEGVVNWLLDRHRDMHLCPVERREGFSPGRGDLLEEPMDSMDGCVRIFPHRAPGEGHFAALLRKGDSPWEPSAEGEGMGFGKRANEGKERTAVSRGTTEDIEERVPGMKLLSENRELEKRLGEAREDVKVFLDQICLPNGMLGYEKDVLAWHSFQEPEHSGLRVLYCGLPVCRWKHKVQPSPQLALALKPGEYSNVLSFRQDDGQLIRYLKGETLQTEEELTGNVLVCVDGFGLGWAQGNGRGMLKNKYHPGWRYQ